MCPSELQQTIDSLETSIIKNSYNDVLNLDAFFQATTTIPPNNHGVFQLEFTKPIVIMSVRFYVEGKLKDVMGNGDNDASMVRNIISANN